MLGLFFGSKQQQDADLQPNDHNVLARRKCPDATVKTKKTSAPLQCPLCRKLMQTATRPLLLQCGHSFCLECIEKMPIYASKNIENAKVPEDKVVSAPAVAEVVEEVHDNTDEPSKLDTELAQHSMVKRLVCSMQMFSSPSSPSLNQLSTKTLISNLERRSGYLHCLQCFGKTLLGDEGILGLESNTFLCSAADRLASQLNTCADCDKQKTSVYCEDCELYLCQTCASRIHSGTKTSRHKVHDLNNDGRSVDSPQSNRCTTHDKEECVLYCSTCKTLVCVHCAYGGHKNHSVSLIEDAVKQLKNELRSKDKSLQKNAELLTEAARNVKKHVFSLESNGASAKHAIKKKFTNIFETLQQLQDSMLVDIDADVERKDGLLTEQWTRFVQDSRDLQLRSQLCATILASSYAPDVVQGIHQQLGCLGSVMDSLPDRKPVVEALVQVSFKSLSKTLISLAGLSENDRNRSPDLRSNVRNRTSDGGTPVLNDSCKRRIANPESARKLTKKAPLLMAASGQEDEMVPQRFVDLTEDEDSLPVPFTYRYNTVEKEHVHRSSTKLSRKTVTRSASTSEHHLPKSMAVEIHPESDI